MPYSVRKSHCPMGQRALRCWPSTPAYRYRGQAGKIQWAGSILPKALHLQHTLGLGRFGRSAAWLWMMSGPFQTGV